MLKYFKVLLVVVGLFHSELSYSLSFDKKSTSVQPSEVIREMNVVRQRLIRWVNYIEKQQLDLFPDSELSDSYLSKKSKIYIKFNLIIKKIPLNISQKDCDVNSLSSIQNTVISADRQAVCVNLPQLMSRYNIDTFRTEIFNSLALEYASIVAFNATSDRKLSLSTANSILELIKKTYNESNEIDLHYFDTLEWHKNNMQRLLSSENLDINVFESAMRDLATESKNVQLKEMISVGQSALSLAQRTQLQAVRLRLLNWEQSLCERRNGHGCRFYMNEAYGTDPVTKQSSRTVSVLRFASILQQARPYEANLINVNTTFSRDTAVKTMKLRCSSVVSIIEKIIADGRSEIDNFYQVK